MSKGFTIIGALAVMAILVIAAGCLQQQPTTGEKPADGGRSRAIDSFLTCADAGYPIMESYPRQCRTPDGQTFVEELPEGEQPVPPADGEGKKGAFCGGIAGFPCAEGLDCVLDGDYPDAGGKCVVSRPPKPAQEGERCGGFDSRPCDTRLVCDVTPGPPGSSDMDTGTCVRSPNAPGAEGCTLMRNRNTREMGCFGCGKTVCIDPIPDFQPLERDPSQPGIPYSCYIDEQGACALAQGQ